jgi:hypothetical protein
MRRLTVGFTVVVLVLLLASVAGAVPPDFCDRNPDHDKCTTTQPPSTTTTTEAPEELAPCPDEMTIVGSGQTMFECLWEPINNGTETATVTISNIEGAIAGPPVLFVRDDSPGDICVLKQGDEWGDPTEGPTGPQYVAEFDLLYRQVPEGYEAWLGHSYWDFVYDPEADPPMEPGTHWCAPQDPILDSLRYDTNGGTLHFQISFNAKKGGSLHFTLEPGNSL